MSRMVLNGRMVELHDAQNRVYGYGHWCPGCKHFHPYFVTRRYEQDFGPVWTFSNNFIKPSFRPSMLVYSGGFKRTMEDGTVKDVPRTTHCHYHLLKGRLQFLPDSPHALAGQTVPLPEIETDGEHVWLRGQR